MPFCPKCGWEYPPEVPYCGDCGEPLEETLSPRSERPREEPEVKIAEVANEVLANMWAGLLQSKGIPCLVKAAGISIGGWGYATLLPHYLFVRVSDQARAIALLRKYARDDDRWTSVRPTIGEGPEQDEEEVDED